MEITLQQLNRAASAPQDAIRAAESSYEAKIEQIAARAVTPEGVRVLLVAGPSASGKTTTANLIADAVRRRAHTAQVISLDNFYLDSDDPSYPRLPDGRRDMECAEALNLSAIGACLRAAIAGEAFFVPHYDFRVAARVGQPTRYAPMREGCVIVEGLHALNPKITDALPREQVCKLFISLSTNITDEQGTRILSGRKLRFVRRTVRDLLYRGASAADTLAHWKNVLDGENRHLYPFRAAADWCFDTFHLFEPGVLRAPFLRAVGEIPPHDPYMQITLAAMRQVIAMDEALVPQTSLIREFLPGGVYEHLYGAVDPDISLS